MQVQDCVVEMETFHHILFLVICLTTSFICTVSASGFYMSAVRTRQYSKNATMSDTSGLKSGPSDPPPDMDRFDEAFPKIKSTNLGEIDQLYSQCNGIDIRELTIAQMQELFASKRLTSAALTNCYLQRIHRMNPTLRAVIEVNPDAINEAYKCDSERHEPGRKTIGPLHGIPILLKGNIDTDDKTGTTAGSLAFIGLRPRRDAPVVKQLRKAGCVILGKANLSEFAYFRGTNIPSGWSGKGGQTRNAYNVNHTPEGSSSGSAVAVSVNLAAGSLGSETDGSLIAPASVGSVFTIKPTHGTPTTQGVIPISHNQDTLGPMARTVMDLAVLLDGMVPDEQKNACGGSYAQCLLDRFSTGKFRVGVLRHPFWDLSVINSTDLTFELPKLEKILDSMKNSINFDMVDPVLYAPEILQRISSSKELTVLTHDFKHDINEYLKNNVMGAYPISSNQPSSYPNQYSPTQVGPKRITTLRDIIQFNIEHPTPEGYNQDLLVMSEATDGLNNKTYLDCLQSNRGSARELLDTVLMKYNVDAVIVPSEPRIQNVLNLKLQDSPILGWSVAAIAGYPSLNIPAGIGLYGVPFGLTIIGLPHTEAKLLQIAAALEQLVPNRSMPKFFT